MGPDKHSSNLLGVSPRNEAADPARLVGVRLAGDIAVTGTYRSPILRDQPVAWYGRRLADPRLGAAHVVLHASDTDVSAGFAA